VDTNSHDFTNRKNLSNVECGDLGFLIFCNDTIIISKFGISRRVSNTSFLKLIDLKFKFKKQEVDLFILKNVKPNNFANKNLRMNKLNEPNTVLFLFKVEYAFLTKDVY